MQLSKADIAQLKRNGAKIATKKPEVNYLKEISQQLDVLIASAEKEPEKEEKAEAPKPTTPPEPCSWRFKMERDSEGRLTDIIAEPL